jgi:hypothetical protein
MADPRPHAGLEKIVAEERRNYVGDDDRMDVTSTTSCPLKLALPGRNPISTGFLATQELTLLRWTCADNTVKSVLREAINEEYYDNEKTESLRKKLLKLDKKVARDDKFRVLSEGESEGIKSLVDEIKTKYPPSQYLYVSLGSSPTLITTVLALAVQDAIVVDLPISNVGMEVNELTESDWAKLMTFGGAALEGKEDARNGILIIDVVEKGRGVAFARALLKRCCGNRDIQICSLGAIEPGELGEWLDFGPKPIFQAGTKNEYAKLVCWEIVKCTYKNEKLLRKYEQHSLLDIVNRKIPAPKKDVVFSIRLLNVIKDELDWVKPEGNQICGKIVEQIMPEHDVARAIREICRYTATNVTISWLYAVLKHQHGMSLLQSDKSKQRRFYQLFRPEFEMIFTWIDDRGGSLDAERREQVKKAFWFCLHPDLDLDRDWDSHSI